MVNARVVIDALALLPTCSISVKKSAYLCVEPCNICMPAAEQSCHSSATNVST